MIRISNPRLWIALGVVGAAMLVGWTSVHSQASARATSPAAHRAALTRQAVVEIAPATSALAEPVAAPAAAAPSPPTVVSVNTAPAGEVVLPQQDRCSAVIVQGRPFPMCAPLAPQP